MKRRETKASFVISGIQGEQRGYIVLALLELASVEASLRERS